MKQLVLWREEKKISKYLGSIPNTLIKVESIIHSPGSAGKISNSQFELVSEEKFLVILTRSMDSINH